ncbi:MAG TPA: LysE family translocator [Steroidobacteraceae bacterium]|nr:LysE family translocator [Steroidobacteraceae bacterium]
MLHASTLIPFALLALGLVLTPGPNMMYLVSRSICQGRRAGLVSLGGVALGFVVYTLLTAAGVTALLSTVPLAYDALRLAGAGYLLYLAWQALKPNGRSPFQVRELPPESPRRLFVMGLLTNLLNPKAAVLYLSLIPQFVHPEQGHVFLQMIVLCLTQMTISISVNAAIVACAGTVASFVTRRPVWAGMQRYLMGTVLAGMALRVATEARR